MCSKKDPAQPKIKKRISCVCKAILIRHIHIWLSLAHAGVGLAWVGNTRWAVGVSGSRQHYWTQITCLAHFLYLWNGTLKMFRWGKLIHLRSFSLGLTMVYILIILPVVPLSPYHMISIKPHQWAHSYPGDGENHYAGIRVQEGKFNPLITDAPAPCDICNRLKQSTMQYLSVPFIGLCFTFVVQSLSHVGLFVTPQTVARQAFLPFTISWNLRKLMFIESMMPSNHLILCHPLLLLPSVFSSIKVFPNELALCIRYPKY